MTSKPKFKPIIAFFCDKKRHLICVPYSIENLHKMAKTLKIKRCWYHGGKNAHYDIPKRRVEEIMNKCCVISTREIWEAINGFTNNSTDRKNLPSA